jgi:Integrase zinc binding domain
MEFDCGICFVKEILNASANFLSRPQQEALEKQGTLEIVKTQKVESKYQQNLFTAEKQQDYKDKLESESNVGHRKVFTMVEAKSKQDILKKFYDLPEAGHMGTEKTIDLIERYYTCINMKKEP